MTAEERIRLMEVLMKGVTSIGQVIVENNGTINYNDHRGEPGEQKRKVDTEVLAKGVDGVREYLWKDSAMAVIFCVCRDCYGYTDNMSQFERDFHCAEGLLSNTFRNNPYMRLNISKWEENGAKERVLRLVDAYKKAIDEQQEE